MKGDTCTSSYSVWTQCCHMCVSAQHQHNRWLGKQSSLEAHWQELKLTAHHWKRTLPTMSNLWVIICQRWPAPPAPTHQLDAKHSALHHRHGGVSRTDHPWLSYPLQTASCVLTSASRVSLHVFGDVTTARDAHSVSFNPSCQPWTCLIRLLSNMCRTSEFINIKYKHLPMLAVPNHAITMNSRWTNTAYKCLLWQNNACSKGTSTAHEDHTQPCSHTNTLPWWQTRTWSKSPGHFLICRSPCYNNWQLSNTLDLWFCNWMSYALLFSHLMLRQACPSHWVKGSNLGLRPSSAKNYEVALRALWDEKHGHQGNPFL
jgi:hypothetical protein